MPWLNSYVGIGRHYTQVAKLLETKRVPHCILVAPDGKIVAVDGKVRENNLTKILNELINNKNKKISKRVLKNKYKNGKLI